MRRLRMSPYALALCAATAAFAQPGFEGTWALQVGRSSALPPGMEQRMTIAREGDGLRVKTAIVTDFADREQFEAHHYCFRVSDAEFDAIFGRIEAAKIPYRSSPLGQTDMQINRRLGGKNLYWQDGDGHLWEILTISYARADSPPLHASGSPIS